MPLLKPCMTIAAVCCQPSVEVPLPTCRRSMASWGRPMAAISSAQPFRCAAVGSKPPVPRSDGCAHALVSVTPLLGLACSKGSPQQMVLCLRAFCSLPLSLRSTC